MSELRPKSLDAVLAFWAQELGLSGADLGSTHPGITLSGHALLPGVIALQRGSFVRVAATAGKLDLIHEAIVGRKIAEIFTPEFWQKHVPGLSGKVIGPTLLYYLDKTPDAWKNLAPPPGVTIRGLARADAAAFAEFTATLSSAEQEMSGLEFGPQPTWGAFMGKRLVGVAGFDTWPGKLAHLHVGVRPGYREQGIGRAVVRAAAKGAVTRRRVVQFRTLRENTRAVALANAIGLELFGETIYVRPLGM